MGFDVKSRQKCQSKNACLLKDIKSLLGVRWINGIPMAHDISMEYNGSRSFSINCRRFEGVTA